jgi:rhodanese-related sulfurtransferase
LVGSILLAPEGINGMLAGSSTIVERIEQALQHEPAFAGAFTGIAFKHSACVTRPFGKVSVKVKKEIVPLGIEMVDARLTGIQVSPLDWGDLIKQPDVVLLDNRNSFEFRLGHFEGAIDPQVANFRDFPDFIRAHAGAWKAQGKRVAMYCTGGIRCEKTSAWMLDLGFAGGKVIKHYQALAASDSRLQFPLTRSNTLQTSDHFMQMREADVQAGTKPNAHTEIELLEQRGPWARYGLRPCTGKRHQLRVHMAALGLPILGDRIYPKLMGPGEDETANPLRLLAASISFRDPFSEEERCFASRRQLHFPDSG